MLDHLIFYTFLFCRWQPDSSFKKTNIQKNNMKGIIFDIKRFAVHDGPGIRTTVFMKGCPLSCWWCHNPESIHPNPVCVNKTSILNQKKFIDEEIVGYEIDVPKLMAEIRKESVFMLESGGGVTFSGGEPLLQQSFLLSMLEACHKEGLHTVVDTTAFSAWQPLARVSEFTDLFLIDLKVMDDAAHQKYTGVTNFFILENIRKLLLLGAKIRIRIPAVPGITMTDENIKRSLDFLGGLDRKIEGIDLLPFHQTASHKYKRFGLENRMADLGSINKEELVSIRQKFENAGFIVKVGG